MVCSALSDELPSRVSRRQPTFVRTAAACLLFSPRPSLHLPLKFRQIHGLPTLHLFTKTFPITLLFMNVYVHVLIPVAVRSKAWVYGR